MIASYSLSNGTWILYDGGVNEVDKFYLPDTYLENPAGGATLGVVLSEDNGSHRRFIDNGEIAAMGLTDIAGLTAQFNTDKTAAEGGGVAISSPGTNTSDPNISIGLGSGGSFTTGYGNVLVGNNVGTALDDGFGNVLIGWRAGNAADSGNNTVIGARAGGSSTLGTGRNVIIGSDAGYSCQNGQNVYIGDNSAYYNTTGYFNVAIGKKAGYYNETGNYNVFIGSKAGYNETGSNKLYIASTSTASPLIHGDFSTGILTINSSLGIAAQTAAAASALTPFEGLIVVVSSTDATFTSTGIWIYEGAAWGKFTVV